MLYSMQNLRYGWLLENCKTIGFSLTLTQRLRSRPLSLGCAGSSTTAHKVVAHTTRVVGFWAKNCGRKADPAISGVWQSTTVESCKVLKWHTDYLLLWRYALCVGWCNHKACNHVHYYVDYTVVFSIYYMGACPIITTIQGVLNWKV